MSQRTGYQPPSHNFLLRGVAKQLTPLDNHWFTKFIAALKRGDYEQAERVRKEYRRNNHVCLL